MGLFLFLYCPWILKTWFADRLSPESSVMLHEAWIPGPHHRTTVLELLPKPYSFSHNPR